MLIELELKKKEVAAALTGRLDWQPREDWRLRRIVFGGLGIEEVGTRGLEKGA
jgi:hypothetical protein